MPISTPDFFKMGMVMDGRESGLHPSHNKYFWDFQNTIVANKVSHGNYFVPQGFR